VSALSVTNFRRITGTVSIAPSHPNLKELVVHLDQQYDNDDFPAKLEALKQVIETCPRLDSVYLQGIGNFRITENIWRPICKALYKVQPQLTLGLRDFVFDVDATILLQEFLHQSVTNVHLRVISTSFPLLGSSSSWLPRLLGPSVRAVAVYYEVGDEQDEQVIESRIQEIQHETKEVMTHLNQEEGRNIQEIEFQVFNCEGRYDDVFQPVFDGIPDLLFVNIVHIRYWTSSSFSKDFPGEDDRFSRSKMKILDALAKNISTQTLKLEFIEYGQN
jgi:hypothetical protein